MKKSTKRRTNLHFIISIDNILLIGCQMRYFKNKSVYSNSTLIDEKYRCKSRWKIYM